MTSYDVQRKTCKKTITITQLYRMNHVIIGFTIYSPSIFIPSIMQFIPSIMQFIHSIMQFIPSIMQFIPSIMQFIPSIMQFIPSIMQSLTNSFSSWSIPYSARRAKLFAASAWHNLAFWIPVWV